MGLASTVTVEVRVVRYAFHAAGLTETGVYATEWTTNWIRIWFFPRGSIPSTLTNGGVPDVSLFGTPTANFQGDAQVGCPIDKHFAEMQIIINTDFCGDYAGNAYGGTTCPQTAGLNSWDSYATFVGNNPKNLTESYWAINSLRVYQQAGSSYTTATLSTSISAVVPVASTASASTANVAMGATTTPMATPIVSLANATTTSASATSLYQGPNTASTTVVSSASPGATLTCPLYNNTIYTSVGGAKYVIECGYEHAGGDLPASNGEYVGEYVGSLDACLALCDARPECLAVSWLAGTPAGPCYLKGSVGAVSSNNEVWGAKLVARASMSVGVGNSTSMSTSSTMSLLPPSASVTATGSALASAHVSSLASSSPSTVAQALLSAPTPAAVSSVSPVSHSQGSTSASTPSYMTTTMVIVSGPTTSISAGGLSCPDSDGSIYTPYLGASYIVECGYDRVGGDLSSLGAATLEVCISACDSLTGCVDVSYQAFLRVCYLRGDVGRDAPAGVANENVWGARLVKAKQTSSSTTPPGTVVALNPTFTNIVPAVSSSHYAVSYTTLVATVISSYSSASAATPSSVASISADVSSMSFAGSATSSSGMPVVSSVGLGVQFPYDTVYSAQVSLSLSAAPSAQMSASVHMSSLALSPVIPSRSTPASNSPASSGVTTLSSSAIVSGPTSPSRSTSSSSAARPSSSAILPNSSSALGSTTAGQSVSPSGGSLLAPYTSTTTSSLAASSTPSSSPVSYRYAMLSDNARVFVTSNGGSYV